MTCRVTMWFRDVSDNSLLLLVFISTICVVFGGTSEFSNNDIQSNRTTRLPSAEVVLSTVGNDFEKRVNSVVSEKFPALHATDGFGFSDVLSMYAPVSLKIKNEICRNQSLLYLEELKKFSLWATQMFDSSTKFPVGLLVGSTYDLGNFDECIKVKVEEHSVKGQYCLASVKFRPVDSGIQRHMNSSTWDRIQELSEDPSKRSRNEIHFAMCVPASCTAKDVQIHISDVLKTFSKFYGVSAKVVVDRRMCQVDEAVLLSAGDITFLCVVGFIGALVGIATTYDLLTSMQDFQHCKLSGSYHDIVTSFSASFNLLKLIDHTPSEDGLDCIHGMKFVSICLIIMGHRLMFTLGSPIVNTDFVEEFYTRIGAMILLNGPIIVDTFFNISGFLVCYLLLLKFRKDKKLNIISLYVHRYVRLTPVYLVVLGFYTTLLYKIGNGPLWSEKVGMETERCVTSWWSNILYINNYVHPEQLCMIQSWFITCDMHLFLFSPFLVYLLFKKPMLGKSVLFTLTIVSIAIAFTVTYFKKLDALLLLYIKTLRDPISNPTFRNMYIPTHTRASPYFVGMATGYLRYKMKYNDVKMPKVFVWIGWVIAIILIEGTIFSAWIFYVPGRNYDALTSAFYGAFHRITWSLGTSWMILAMSTGNGAFVEPIFAWRPLVTLSRLSYCAFLCHTGFQLYNVATARIPFYGSIYNLVWFSLGDITLSFFAALGLTLLFESPIIGLERVLLRKTSKQNINLVKDETTLTSIEKPNENHGVVNSGYVFSRTCSTIQMEKESDNNN